MAQSSAFQKDSLDRVSAADGGGATALREQAFERFEAMPLPSPETEEWRYTDVSDLLLDAFSARGRAARGRIARPGRDRRAGGPRRGRATAPGWPSSTTPASSSPTSTPRWRRPACASRASTPRSATHPDLVEGRLHGAVPFDRTKFTALHAAFRTGGTFVYVPKGVKVELPLQTLTYVGRDGLAVFPHTVLVVGGGRGGDLRRPVRVARPRARVLQRGRRDLCRPGREGPLRRAPGLGERRDPPLRPARGRRAATPTCARWRWRSAPSLSRMEAESLLEGDGGSSEMLGVYFGDGDQRFDFRSIQDHVGSDTSSRPAVQGRDEGPLERDLLGDRDHPARARTAATRTRRTATSC